MYFDVYSYVLLLPFILTEVRGKAGIQYRISADNFDKGKHE